MNFNIPKEDRLRILQILADFGGNYAEAAKTCHYTAAAVEWVDITENRKYGWTERGRGNPALEKYLIARTSVFSGTSWDNNDPDIAAARAAYDRGEVNLTTGRDGQWLILYAIPRKGKPTNQAYFGVDTSQKLSSMSKTHSVEELKRMTQPKIFLFNGPPRAGKDTLASLLEAEFPKSKIVKFAAPLKRGVPAFYGIPVEQWKSLDSSELKDVPSDWLSGKTPREAQIGMSEVYAKPFHGASGKRNEGIFGEILSKEIDLIRSREDKNLFFVSDSGFAPEAEVLIKRYGAENIFLFRLYREGCNFKIDSRGYIDLESHGVNTWEISNLEGHPQLMFETVKRIVSDIQTHLTA